MHSSPRERRRANRRRSRRADASNNLPARTRAFRAPELPSLSTLAGLRSNPWGAASYPRRPDASRRRIARSEFCSGRDLPSSAEYKVPANIRSRGLDATFLAMRSIATFTLVLGVAALGCDEPSATPPAASSSPPAPSSAPSNVPSAAAEAVAAPASASASPAPDTIIAQHILVAYGSARRAPGA